MKLESRGGLRESALARLATEVTDLRTLADVIAWGRSHRSLMLSPAVVADVVIQDEFTQDLLVPLEGGEVLAFGSTCLGKITAVAVWPRVPTATELLRARLEAGWTPRPSQLQDGDRILGHAACLSL